MNHILYILIISLLIHFQIYSQDKSSPKEPYELISLEDLKSILIQESDSSQDLEKKISKSLSFIEKYYSQFPDDRRTAEERGRAGDYLDPLSGEVTKTFKQNSSKIPFRLNVNAIRLLKIDHEKHPSSSSFIMDSNTFYKLYSNLALLYMKKNEEQRAINHFLTAFKFHDFSQNEEVLFSEIDNKDNYDPDRQNKIRNHKEILKQKIDKENEIKKIIDEFHLTAANNARLGNPLPDEKSHKQKVETLQNEFNSLNLKYENSFQKEFYELQLEKGSYDSKVIKEFSKLVRKTELEKRVLLRLKNPYPLIEPDKESGFDTYSNLLELSARLYSKDPEIFKLLGDEFKSSGKLQKAIDNYLNYFSSGGNNKNEKIEVSLSLAGLYSGMRNYIQSVEYYNQYLDLQNDGKLKMDILFILGDIYYRRLGNYPTASEYLGQFVNLAEKEVFTENQELIEIKHQKKIMSANYYLSAYYKSILNRNKEEEFLLKSYENYLKIKGLNNSFQNKIDIKKNLIDGLRKKALNNSEPLLNESLKEEKLKYDELLAIQKSIQIEIRSLPLIDLLFQMAERNENKRDYDKTISIYREIQDSGVPSDRELALKNIRRIENIKYDGIYRERTSR